MGREWFSLDVRACVMESRARVWQAVCEMKIKKETNVHVVVCTHLYSAVVCKHPWRSLESWSVPQEWLDCGTQAYTLSLGCKSSHHSDLGVGARERLAGPAGTGTGTQLWAVGRAGRQARTRLSHRRHARLDSWLSPYTFREPPVEETSLLPLTHWPAFPIL